MSRLQRHGFTFVELLVVLAIIAITIGMALPATRRVKGTAERMRCMNNLKQIMLGLHNFEEVPPSADPPAVSRRFPTGCIGPGAMPDERLSWMVAALPHVEQQNLFGKFDAAKGYADNLAASTTVVKTFFCAVPEEGMPDEAVTHYVALAGIGYAAAGQPTGTAGNGFMGYDRFTAMATITDGTSNTVALMETRSGLGPWARGGWSTLRGFDPADVPIHGEGRPFGGHPGGMNVAMADGSVRFLRASIDPGVLAKAVTIAGGEILGSDF